MSKQKIYSIILLSAFIYIIFLSQPLTLAGGPYLRLVMLDVGQGDSFLLQTPAGRSLLFDAGATAAISQQLGRYLPWWQKRLDIVVITHSDLDHFGGLLSLLDSYEIGEVWFNGDYGTTNRQYAALMERLQQRQIPTKILVAGQRHVFDQTVLDIIWPQDMSLTADNDRSIVARLSYGQTDVLLTGDISDEVELRLLRSGVLLEAEILKVAHHGSKSSSHQDFLTKVKPVFCLISAGQDNQYGHPHQEVLQRLMARECAVFETSGQGGVELWLGRSSVAVSTTLPGGGLSGILKPN